MEIDRALYRSRLHGCARRDWWPLGLYYDSVVNAVLYVSGDTISELDFISKGMDDWEPCDNEGRPCIEDDGLGSTNRRVHQVIRYMVVDDRMDGTDIYPEQTLAEAYKALANRIMNDKGYNLRPYRQRRPLWLRLARYLQWLDEKGY